MGNIFPSTLACHSQPGSSNIQQTSLKVTQSAGKLPTFCRAGCRKTTCTLPEILGTHHCPPQREKSLPRIQCAAPLSFFVFHLLCYRFRLPHSSAPTLNSASLLLLESGYLQRTLPAKFRGPAREAASSQQQSFHHLISSHSHCQMILPLPLQQNTHTAQYLYHISKLLSSSLQNLYHLSKLPRHQPQPHKSLEPGCIQSWP